MEPSHSQSLARFCISQGPFLPSLGAYPARIRLGSSPVACFRIGSLRPALHCIRFLRQRPETYGNSVRPAFFPQLRIENRLRILCAHRSAGMIVSSKRGEVKIFESADDLGTSLADYITELADVAVKERGAFAVVLSGGSLISTLGKLCEPPYLKTIDWSKWHVFWADERVVARNHPDSNYKLAKDGLLSKVPILPGQVYSINEALSPEAAADDYEVGLRHLVKTRIVGVSTISDCPRFDLILLGMGPDGHVASLFPGHPLTHEKEKWITSITDSPKPPPERITFTFPVINSAANVVMVLTGSNKAEVLEKTFGEELPPGVLPVQMVFPADGKLVWFLDKAASSKLPGVNHLA